MLNTNPAPPIFEFNKILASLVKIQHFQTAISLFQQMQLRRIRTDIVNLNIFINCFCHLHQLNFAFSVFANILKLGFHPDTITITTLIRGLCDSGKLHKALHFHDDVIANGFQLDHVSYGTLIGGLCKIGETKAAMQVLKKIEEGLLVKLDVLMYNTVIDSLGKDNL
ncbi:unnamed protein product [Vicia faba]|uniref:Pentatricopeptide repeat-containing protein n=1 Tax=Vicia faba TaxID=3906 RepID=A0AAV0ZAS9_VICFA|nr:unnamed protein product [Vicia faba]